MDVGYSIRRGSTLPVFRVRFTRGKPRAAEADRAPVSLVGVTRLSFALRPVERAGTAGAPNTLERDMVIDPLVGGEAYYLWLAGETLLPVGLYVCEFAAYSASGREGFPSGEWFGFNVEPSILA